MVHEDYSSEKVPLITVCAREWVEGWGVDVAHIVYICMCVHSVCLCSVPGEKLMMNIFCTLWLL